MFATRTPTLPPATHTNSFALGTAEVLLVEPATPYEDERREWLAWIAGLVSQGRRPIAIVLTHHHPDHVGGAAFLSAELGLPVWAHRATADRLVGHVHVDRCLADGETLIVEGPTPQRYSVLHTPGHAPGHVCLHDAHAGVLVAGDMVASQGTILIEPRDGHMATYLHQLDRLAALDAHVALPAHGDPIDQPTALFRHYIAHRLAREQKAIDALTSMGQGIEALVPIVYADTSPAAWPIAKLSLEAHYVKLEADGRAERIGEKWRRTPWKRDT